MPELPEVEIAARNLRRWAIGHRVERVETSLSGKAARLCRPEPPSSLEELGGARFEEVDRIGKHLLLRLSARRQRVGLYSHLGMSGRWVRRPRGSRLPAPAHSRVRLALDDESVLHFCDTRLFGRILVVPGADLASLPEVADLGPDPLADGVDEARLAERLARTGAAVKVALLDQSLVPGVGNIQASEALFRARVDPRRPGRDLGRAEVRRLARAIVESIEATIAAARFDPETGDYRYVEEGGENPFAVYGREGEPCPRCRHEKVKRVVLGGRAAFFCPACQK